MHTTVVALGLAVQSRLISAQKSLNVSMFKNYLNNYNNRKKTRLENLG